MAENIQYPAMAQRESSTLATAKAITTVAEVNKSFE